MSDDLIFGKPDKKNLPDVVATDAFVLADFEHPVSNTPLPNVVWSKEKHEVAQMLALSGKNKTAISRETGIPVPTITKWLQHGEFQDYINSIVLESAEQSKAKRLSLLNKILDARIEEAERTGDYARLSKMDTLEVLGQIRKETGDEDKAKESTYAQVLEKILSASKTQVIELVPSQN